MQVKNKINLLMECLSEKELHEIYLIIAKITDKDMILKKILENKDIFINLSKFLSRKDIHALTVLNKGYRDLTNILMKEEQITTIMEEKRKVERAKVFPVCYIEMEQIFHRDPESMQVMRKYCFTSSTFPERLKGITIGDVVKICHGEYFILTMSQTEKDDKFVLTKASKQGEFIVPENIVFEAFYVNYWDTITNKINMWVPIYEHDEKSIVFDDQKQMMILKKSFTVTGTNKKDYVNLIFNLADYNYHEWKNASQETLMQLVANLRKLYGHFDEFKKEQSKVEVFTFRASNDEHNTLHVWTDIRRRRRMAMYRT